jgi:hypothetical protein
MVNPLTKMSKKHTFKKVYFVLPTEVKKRIAEIVELETELQQLSDAISKRLNARLVNAARYVQSKYISESIPFCETIEITKTHFARNLNGSDYIKDLQLLKDGGVIITDESYQFYKESDKVGRCKSYIFNPELIYSDAVILSHDLKYKTKFGTGKIERTTVGLISKLRTTVKAKDVQKEVNRIVTMPFIENRCLIGSNIPCKAHKCDITTENDGNIKRYLTKEKVLEYAKNKGLNAIFYKPNGKIYFRNKKEFLRERFQEMRIKYCDILLKVGQLSNRALINCKRNNTNTRLDTNLTSLPSCFFKFLRTSGEELVGWDLANSQFLLMANLMAATLKNDDDTFADFLKDEESEIYEIARLTTEKVVNEMEGNINDIFAFINQTRNGIFYQCFANQSFEQVYKERYPEYENLFQLEQLIHFHKYRFQRTTNPLMKEIKYQVMTESQHKKIAEKLEYKFNQIRKESKNTMFATAFSSYKYNPQSKQRLRKHYPSVVAWMDVFKQTSIQYFDRLKKHEPKRFKAIVSDRKKKDAYSLGNSHLAVSLQVIESKIFIDYILESCFIAGFSAFSKHDSILFKESQSSKGKKLMTNILDEILGCGNYRLAAN